MSSTAQLTIGHTVQTQASDHGGVSNAMEVDEEVPGSVSGEEEALPPEFARKQFCARLSRVVDEEVEDLETAQIIDLLEALPGNYSAEVETQNQLPEVRHIFVPWFLVC
jgi:hypothetical protein